MVFAGAGVDSVLKRALRSCIPIQVERSVPARGKYVDFVANHLQVGDGVSARQLMKLMVAGSPEQVLRDACIESLTGSSLQSQTQVIATLAALGLQDQRQLFFDSRNPNPLFKARNEIAHDMDMTPAGVAGRGRRTRHERTVAAYVSMCHTGLNYCQRVLNCLEVELAAKS